MRRSTVVLVLFAIASTLAAQAPDEGTAKGLGVAYHEYWSSYYASDGSAYYYPYISWTQFQVTGFIDRKGPFNIGPHGTRLHLEARLGFGGVGDDGTADPTIPNSDNGFSVGGAAIIRAPLGATGKFYVGTGVDFSALTASGHSGSGYFADGWGELLITVPLVAGFTTSSAKWNIRPEFRYAVFGTSSSDLEPPGTDGVDENDAPGTLALVVSFSRKKTP